MKLKYYGYVVVLLAVAFTLGRFSGPTKTVEREVIKTVTKYVEATTKKGVIREKEIKMPDGTIHTARIIDYSVTSRIDHSSETSTEKYKSSDSTFQNQVSILFTLPDRMDLTFGDRSKIELGLSRKLFSSLYATVQTDLEFKSFKIGLSFGF